ncbi:MAG: protoporphyrinogen oxidase HemJ [Pseudomonadota bacterium]
MSDLLSLAYPWTKALHIMAVIAWMAGLFYLPRLYVYHTEQVGQSGDTHALFQTMEKKLLRVIMNPAMIASWCFGVLLVVTPGVVDWTAVWPWTKLMGIVGMTWFHIWLAKRRKSFASGENTLSGRQYRMMNEVPTLLMVLIVVSVVVKFG